MTYPTHCAFAAQLRSAFAISGAAAQAVPLERGAVSPPPGGQTCDGPTAPRPHGPTAFSLGFLGDEVLRLGQGIPVFSRPQLGEFDLFIVPLGTSRTTARMQHEAVFN